MIDSKFLLLAIAVSLFIFFVNPLSASVESGSFLLEKKLVLAHFMTGDIQRSNYKGEVLNGVSANYDKYSPEGSLAAIGGGQQAAPMYMLMARDRTVSLQEAVTQELRAAAKYGVDGFHFYYPLHRGDSFMKRYNAIITMFFTVAAEQYPDFKMTLCLCNPTGGNEVEKISLWSYHIRNLFKYIGESKNWLLTKDGRLLFFLWCQDGLADAVKDQHWLVDQFPQRVKSVALAYKKLAAAIGHDIAYMYDIRFPKNDRLVDVVLKHFAGVWSWTGNLESLPHLKILAEKSKQQQKDFCLSIYPDYYTGKLYTKKKPHQWVRPNKKNIKDLDPTKLERHYQNCGLSLVYRKFFEFAIDEKLPIISITTWNDYPEGHHIAPEGNHNFAPAVLLEYYKSKWLGSEHGIKESVSVFFKKYPLAAKPRHHFELYTKSTAGDPSLEEGIELVTILHGDADVYVNDQWIGLAKKGLFSLRHPFQLGSIKVEIKRQDRVILTLVPALKISDKPYRTDRLTYMYSSRFNEYFEAIFGSGRVVPTLWEVKN